MKAPTIQPPLTPEDRQSLEDAYRQAIGTVRALARALGKPCPIVSREERRKPSCHPLAMGDILHTDNQ